MALHPCRECRQQVSREARSCPHCGAVRPGPTTFGDVAGALVAFAFIAVIALIVLANVL